MSLYNSNSIALARTNIGVALDFAMSDVMRSPLREIKSLLNNGDVDSSAALIDDTLDECFDPLIKDHLLKAYSYLQDVS